MDGTCSSTSISTRTQGGKRKDLARNDVPYYSSQMSRKASTDSQRSLRTRSDRGQKQKYTEQSSTSSGSEKEDHDVSLRMNGERALVSEEPSYTTEDEDGKEMIKAVANLTKYINSSRSNSLDSQHSYLSSRSKSLPERTKAGSPTTKLARPSISENGCETQEKLTDIDTNTITPKIETVDEPTERFLTIYSDNRPRDGTSIEARSEQSPESELSDAISMGQQPSSYAQSAFSITNSNETKSEPPESLNPSIEIIPVKKRRGRPPKNRILFDQTVKSRNTSAEAEQLVPRQRRRKREVSQSIFESRFQKYAVQ